MMPVSLQVSETALSLLQSGGRWFETTSAHGKAAGQGPEASQRPVSHPVVTRCSRPAAMIPAMRAASRPTPWICSDDFE